MVFYRTVGLVILAGAVVGCVVPTQRVDICGDQVVTGPEACDDGNVAAGDGCSPVCVVESVVCGDQVVSPGEGCDDGNIIAGDGCSATCAIEQRTRVNVGWLFKTNDMTVAPTPGYNTIRIVSHPHALPRTDTSHDKIDLFDASTSSGMLAPLVVGEYDQWMELTTTNGANVYAQSLPKLVTLTVGVEPTVTFEIHNDKGYYFGRWTLQGAAGALTCAAVPEVVFIAITALNPFGGTSVFDCEPHEGYTVPILSGLHAPSVTAGRDGQNFASVTLSPMQVFAPNKVTDFGTVMLMIPGH